MLKIPVYFEIYCSCGKAMCNNTDVFRTKIIVSPCDRCLKEEHNKGYEDGLRHKEEK